MPELPEVETVRRIIGPQIIGRTIEDAIIDRPTVVEYPSVEDFVAGVTGRTVTDMDRRGKFMAIRLDDGSSIVLHLRMTGQLLVAPPDMPAEKHTHAVFVLSDGNELRFIDMRRFGRFWFFANGEDNTSGMSELGPEPFSEELCPAHLMGRLRTRRALKDCLLDQSIIAGIGNIYSDEVLFLSGIRPDTPADSITADDCGRIIDNVHLVLEKAIERNAMSPEEYLAGRGKEYRNWDFNVYGRKGERCLCCGNIIEKIKVAGRSSCYCPMCQR